MTGQAESGKKKKPKGSKKARCGAARLAAAQTVFLILSTGRNAEEAARDYLSHYAGMPTEDGAGLLEPDQELYVSIVRGIEARRADLEHILKRNISNEREAFDLLLKSILLCGCFEILAHRDIDAPVIISDWLHVTRAFYDGREVALVNAVLDAVKKIAR